MNPSNWTWRGHDSQYEKINEAEDSSSEFGTEQTGFISPKIHQRTFSAAFWIGTALNFVVFLLSITLFVTSFRISPNAAAKVLSQHCTSSRLRILCSWWLTENLAPFLDAVTLKIKDVKVNGTLFPPEKPSFSRAEPGMPDAEAIWERFEPSGFFPITRDELVRIGKDPEVSVKFPNEVYGFGEEAYVASFDTLHKIHCLNELRKSTFWNYPDMQQYFSGSDHDLSYRNQSHTKKWWIHLRHCVDLVAQDLICHADADLVTYTWRDMQPQPYPDMSINKKCRDLNQLMDYNDANKVDIKLYSKVQKYRPELDTKLLPHEKQWYLQNGFQDSTLFPNGEGFDEYWKDHEE